ncbi:MAG: hypothetical protein Q3M30_05445 [Candidatus Electrothrix sp. Rat3]|nr:hypothetical protein [Candidatus Electrothrix rattekaaiensis]
MTNLKQESRSFTPPLFFGASHQATLLSFWNLDELNCFEWHPAEYQRLIFRAGNKSTLSLKRIPSIIISPNETKRKPNRLKNTKSGWRIEK